jgi:glycosyltransferase involved in cell wall biosynthesis
VFVTPAAEAFVTALLGGYPRNACSIPNGIDIARFRPATPAERRAARIRFELPDDRAVILFIGRLVEQKGIDLLVEVARRLSSMHFLIVGDGPLGDRIPAGPNITWRRSIDPEQVHACYHAADCLLLPSYGEGLPLVVQEAAACGLVSIISENESYSRPLIAQQICIPAARTPDAIAERLHDLLTGGTPASSSNARSYAEAHWDVGSMVSRYVMLLEGLSAGSRRAYQGRARLEPVDSSG